MRQAWNSRHSETPFEAQQVLVTVPASFDAVARELTLKAAEQAGFTEDDGTLGEMLDVVAKSDLAILLISDAAMASRYEEVFGALKPGATLVFDVELLDIVKEAK